MVTRYHLLSFVVTRCHLLYHSLSLVFTRCTTRYHSLSLVVTRFHSLCHSLSFVVTRCHLLSFVVPVVVTRCHSMYRSSVFLKTIEVFYKKAVLQNFSIFAGKDLCSTLFLIKLRAFMFATF